MIEITDGREMMSMTEEDLLLALTELYEASQAMTSGLVHSAEAMERYYLSIVMGGKID